MKIALTKRFALALVLASLLSGCASLMQPSTQSAAATDASRAKVVFMRSSIVAGAIGADLFEVNGGDLKMIGQLPTGNKIVYETTPGDKVFMAHGMATDFMTATLAGGRTYYVIVRPNWGTGGFAPTPIRVDGSTDYNTGTADFRDWLRSTKQIEANQAETKGWLASNKPRYQDLYSQYWARFQQKTASEKAERHLRPQDGFATPF
jgi:hypothetical protein